MEPAYVITFSVMFTLLFFMVGGIIGWLTYRHLIENRPPYLHPEFFDENGQVIPDEIVAVTFENSDYDYDYDDEIEENDD
jgi:hypothetical protein